MKKDKKYAIGITVAVVVLIGAYFVFSEKTVDNKTIQREGVTSEVQMKAVGDLENVKVFEVMGSNFSFSPSEIRVKIGDKVRINFTSQNGFHDFVIDEFAVKTAQMNSGGKETVEFVADKAGTFEYYCSVGTHRQMGMVGKLIVD